MKGTLDILDSDWGKEIFEVPLPFARTMKLVGIEDARFTKGWGTESSDEFWSYIFAWKIDHEGKVSKELLEVNLSLYFERLMSKQKGELDSTSVTKFKVVKEAEGATEFEGS
jgi:hypothetical protein